MFPVSGPRQRNNWLEIMGVRVMGEQEEEGGGNVNSKKKVTHASGLNATMITASACPANVCTSAAAAFPAAEPAIRRSKRRTVLSADPVMTQSVLSGDQSQQWTSVSCAFSI